MIVYRLGSSKHSHDLSGKGAELVGGRWNSKGVAMLYTCSSRALSVTEVAVHTPLGIVPSDYCLTQIDLSGNITIYELPQTQYPKDWQEFPHPVSTKRIGDKFIKDGKHLVMQVISAVVPGDFNYLINPNHKDASKIWIRNVSAFEFDERLFKK